MEEDPEMPPIEDLEMTMERDTKLHTSQRKYRIRWCPKQERHISKSQKKIQIKRVMEVSMVETDNQSVI
eukprot:7401308-Ditylum_brightwellii.AAC.1